MTDTMLGKAPSDQDVEAVAAFVESLSTPPNPQRQSGTRNALSERGEKVFQSEKAGCSNCHPAPLYTDGKKHDVGLGSDDDVYDDYNTPSLHGIYDRVRFLHDGRASSLEEVLTGPHNPARVTGLGELSKDELESLLAYLRSI
jgi:cytochrome c peroxidase